MDALVAGDAPAAAAGCEDEEAQDGDAVDEEAGGGSAEEGRCGLGDGRLYNTLERLLTRFTVFDHFTESGPVAHRRGLSSAPGSCEAAASGDVDGGGARSLAGPPGRGRSAGLAATRSVATKADGEAADAWAEAEQAARGARGAIKGAEGRLLAAKIAAEAGVSAAGGDGSACLATALEEGARLVQREAESCKAALQERWEKLKELLAELAAAKEGARGAASDGMMAAAGRAISGAAAAAAVAKRGSRLIVLLARDGATGVVEAAVMTAAAELDLQTEGWVLEAQAASARAAALRTRAEEAEAEAEAAADRAAAAERAAAEARTALAEAARSAVEAGGRAAREIWAAVEQAAGEIRAAAVAAVAAKKEEAVQAAEAAAGEAAEAAQVAAAAAAAPGASEEECSWSGEDVGAPNRQTRDQTGSGQDQKGNRTTDPAVGPIKLSVSAAPAARAAAVRESAVAVTEAAAAAARRLGERAVRMARAAPARAGLLAAAAADAAALDGERAVNGVGDDAMAAAAAAAAAAAEDASWAAASADAAHTAKVRRAESAMTSTAADRALVPRARQAAAAAAGRACARLVPGFFAPLFAAREEGRGPDPLGPRDIPCAFCWERFDWLGPPARRAVLSGCCGRRLCAGCADACASTLVGNPEARCPFAHFGCAASAAGLAEGLRREDDALRLRWGLARELGFEFPPDEAAQVAAV